MVTLAPPPSQTLSGMWATVALALPVSHPLTVQYPGITTTPRTLTTIRFVKLSMVCPPPAGLDPGVRTRAGAGRDYKIGIGGAGIKAPGRPAVTVRPAVAGVSGPWIESGLHPLSPCDV